MFEIHEYKKHGFYIKRNLLSVNTCKNIISQLNEIKTDMKIPHTNIQFGYGNIINHPLANIVTENKYIKFFCEQIYGKEYFYNSVYVHNKHRWVGPDVEWHQEVFNMKTFHPTNNNYTLEEIKNNFMQVYIALEDQSIENGGMKIIPYQDSILEHYDTTNIHLNHKRAIMPEELDKIYKTHGIINLDLKVGDVIFFNHLIPHSSSSNNSPINRKAMVFLTYKNNDCFNENIRVSEKNYRKQFVLNYLKNTLHSKTENTMYQCGNKTKHIKEKHWNSIFEELPWYDKKFENDYSIESLLAANGHSSSEYAKYTLEKWETTIDNIKKNLNYDVNKKYNIMEIGCGAGCVLKYMEGNNIYGIDPSKRYLKIIKKAIEGNFILGDALSLKKFSDNKFDIIICYSTSQYFPDINYMKKFIDLCYDKLNIGGRLFIGDILDNDLKEEYKNFRIEQMGEIKYNEKYIKTGLTHFYISKKELQDISSQFKLIKFENAEKRGNEQISYRYNVYYEKFNTRINNLLTNENTMEYLYTLKDFPVSLSCVPIDLNHNKTLDMIFEICKKTGIIQIKNAPSLQDIYIMPHNSSYGKVWNNLFDTFASILKKYIKNEMNILEIGGGSLLLASKILTNNKIKNYTVYEKNVTSKYIDKRINIIDKYFTKDTIINEKYNFYIHSHVLEHIWNPCEFIESIGNNIETDCNHCFIVPNLKEILSKKYTNALDFEHNFFIIEEYIDIILHNNNFKILEKKYYLDHSIIYITKKIKNTNLVLKSFPNLYIENKIIAMNFYNYHTDLIKKLNKQIDNFNGDVYLFGGTGFSIYLIVFGLKTDRIICILDNDTEKENKKVYGTNFIIKNPLIIKNKKNVAIIVKAANYQQEIEEQLYKLNSNILILK
jgi:ubiquinone/menaquinone biosynthesis C-methylase UbiE